MAEFLMLFRGGDGPILRASSPEKWQAHLQKWMVWIDDLRAQGKMIGAQPLTDSGKVVTGTKKVVTDGPFMEGKEMVGGYLSCRAENYEEAVAISRGCPIFEFEDGIVEVREIQLLHM